MKKTSLCILLLSQMIGASALVAKESPAILGFGVTGGAGSFTGDFGNSSNISSYGFELLFGHEGDSKNFFSFFSMPFSNFSFENTGTKFGFNQEKIEISRSGIIPNLCYRAVWEIAGCLGIGFQNIDVSDRSRDNRHNYGGVGGQLRLGRFQGEGFIGGVVFDYFQVEETRNKVRASATFMPLVAMLGYQKQIGN